MHSKKPPKTSSLASVVFSKVSAVRLCFDRRHVGLVLPQDLPGMRWAAEIAVTTVDSNVPKHKGARRKACIRALQSEHGSLHDSIRGFGDVAKRCDLREKILGASADTCMSVRADDRYIAVAVDTGKELGGFGDDGAPDTAISECYV